jgi:hypothetical protein
MYELLFLVGALLPILIPVAIIIAVVKSRKTNRLLRVHDAEIIGLKDEIRRLGAHMKSVERKVRELRLAAGDVARVSGEVEMGAQARRAAKPAVTRKEKIAKKVVKPALPVKRKREPAPPDQIDLDGVQPRAPEVVEGEPAKAAPKARLTPPEPTAWDVLAAKFLSNWIGILGTVVLVAGIGFLGTYAALKMPPFARFVLVLMASATLFAGYLSLRRRERWEAMALWLRSSAAAVFLFACAAAGGLPNVGLMWIDSAGPALAVLLVGVVVNLALAWSVGREGFATLHVVLALIPMAILPQATITLGIVTAIAVFGVLLAQRHQWTYHLMASMLIYGAYHVFWIIKQGLALPLPGKLPAIAVGSAAIVYLGSALSNYRRPSAKKKLDTDTIVSHLASWGALAAAYLLHLQQLERFGIEVLGPVLLATGLVAFGLSINAKRREIRWLRDADVLIAQAFVIGSLFTWRSQLGPPIIFNGLIFLETLLFLRLVINDGMRPAVLVGAYASLAAAVLFILAGFWSFGGLEDGVGIWQLAALMFTGAIVTVLSGAYLKRNHPTQIVELAGPKGLRLVGPLAGLMTVVALASLYRNVEFGIAALAMVGTLCYAGRQLKDLGLVRGLWLTMLTTHLIAWFVSFGNCAAMPLHQIVQLAPAAVLTALVIWRTPGDRGMVEQRQAAVMVLGINLGVSAFLLLHPASALMPTLAWVLMSLIALETANRLATREMAIPVLNLGHGYVLAAGIGYVTVILPTLTYLYTINLRMVMEVFGMAALLYWWLTRPSESLGETHSWRNVHPYFLELMIALLATTVFIEVPLVWRPVAWMAIAFLLLAPQLAEVSTRFMFYSLLAYITSVIAVTVNVSRAAVPSGIWYEQPWHTGLVAIVIQFLYLLAAYQRLELEKVRFPPLMYRIEHLSQILSRDRAAAICYPFFAGLALFLAWRFERALLTFLWASETFGIFILSIVLRQNHFRLVALAGLAACLLRLVIYDMQEADLLVRGLAFVGVGSLMLAMNAVYNKYGTRVGTS